MIHLRKMKKEDRAHSKLGLKSCAGFLLFMFVMTLISKWISWEMKPEVTICDSDYKEVKQVDWAIGSITNGQPEYSMKSSLKGGKPKVEAYTEEGKIDIAKIENVNECLFKITYDYGTATYVIPRASITSDDGLSTKVYTVDLGDNKINPYNIVENSVSINNKTAEECDITSSLENVVVESSKSILEGSSVRIKKDNILDQKGRIELVPQKGAFFTSSYSVWMLKKICPKGTTFEEKEPDNYTRITIPVAKGTNIQEVQSLMREIYRNTKLNENTMEYSFLGSNSYIDLPSHVMNFLFMLMILILVVLTVYWDIRQYGKVLRRRCLEAGTKKSLEEDLVVILIRLILYSMAVILCCILISNVFAYNFNLIGRWLPAERVLDIQHYKNLYHVWLTNKNNYLSLYPTGKGAQYYHLLSRNWNKFFYEVAGLFVGWSVLLITIKKVIHRTDRVLKI